MLCICLVLLFYAFIYKAVYQRRRTRTKKLSTYQKILRSYLITNPREDRPRTRSSLKLICCYCCDKFRSSSSSSSSTSSLSHGAFHPSLNHHRRDRDSHDEDTPVTRTRPEQVVLEIKGARGKRYSAISMTSMTYFTSGVWDETLPTSLVRSRINSVAATTFCGTEHSMTSRPSTSTEDSFDQTATKLLAMHNASVPSKSATHLMVPGKPSLLSVDVHTKDNPSADAEPLGAGSVHSSLLRKPSHTLPIRQQPRSSDLSVQHRKVSFSKSPQCQISQRAHGSNDVSSC